MASQPAPSWSHVAIAAPVRSSLPVQTSAYFTDLEWSVVAMAERDGLSSLRKPTRFWALVGLIFGLKPANRLANDRLEALRRIAVLSWRYRWNIAGSELKAFFDAGYSRTYELILRRISAVRAGKRGGRW